MSVKERLESFYENRFRPLNLEFKQIATDWQMRKIGNRLEINDHRDLEYDFSVLDKLDRLHKRVNAMKEELISILPECQDYFVRFEKAKRRLDDLEYAFLTSPKVDSCHTVWFEMHDYLIKKLGKKREEDEI